MRTRLLSSYQWRDHGGQWPGRVRELLHRDVLCHVRRLRGGAGVSTLYIVSAFESHKRILILPIVVLILHAQ